MSVEPNKWGVIYNPKAGTRKVQKLSLIHISEPTRH